VAAMLTPAPDANIYTEEFGWALAKRKAKR
jgi:hypothetical protein